jgi:hypothetical protein
MNSRTFKIIALAVLLVLVSCAMSCSCFPSDGFLGIKGRVYEWINAPAEATSKIYIEEVGKASEIEPTLEKMQENIAGDISILPGGYARIDIGLKSSIEEGGGDYIWKTRSDSEGNIGDGWITAPGGKKLLVRVRKLGYMEVIGEVEQSGASNLVIIAILVKNND